MKCPQCGNQVQARDRYCSQCGTALQSDTSATTGRRRPIQWTDTHYIINLGSREPIKIEKEQAHQYAKTAATALVTVIGPRLGRRRR